MKKFTNLSLISIILLMATVFLTNCKKDDPIVPAFTVSAVPVTLQGGDAGLQFFAKCNNDDVKMTKVTIGDPLAQQNYTYNLNGTTFVKDELFGLQETNTAYVKELGTWTFTFVGNRTADGSSFNVTASLSVTGK